MTLGGAISPADIEVVLDQNAEDLRFAGPGPSDPTRLDYRGVTLKMLIGRAYGVTKQQVSGPAWIEQDRFDVAASVPVGTDKPTLRLMLQALLEERFDLRLQRTTRTIPIYRLTIGKGGTRLKAGANPTPAPTSRQLVERRGISISLGPVPMSVFVDLISRRLDRPLVDATNLREKYHFRLFWQNESATGADPVPIGIALEDQLGLKLERVNAPMDAYVVTTARRTATEN